MKKLLAALCMLVAPLGMLAAPLAQAQTCPEKHLNYYQAFPAGGESDLSARHQQMVLKKRCPAIAKQMTVMPSPMMIRASTVISHSEFVQA